MPRLPHPLFRLSALNGLSSRMKTAAHSAVRGSVSDLRGLIMTAASAPESYRRPLFAAYYAVLDPETLEEVCKTSDYDDVETTTRLTRIFVAISSLAVLVESVSIPNDALVELWQRLWPFFDYIDSHIEYLPIVSTGMGSPSVVYGVIVRLQSKIWSSCRSESAVCKTPGARTLLAHGWRELLRVQDAKGLQDVSLLFVVGSIGSSQAPAGQFKEFLAANGGWDNLARNIAAHLRFATTSIAAAAEGRSTLPLASLDYLMTNAYSRYPDLRAALRRHGYITRLTAAILVLPDNVEHRQIFSRLPDILRTIQLPFHFDRSHRSLLECLRVGALKLVSAYAPLDTLNIAQRDLMSLMNRIAGETSYPPVAQELARSIANLPAPTFTNHDLTEAWARLEELAEDREPMSRLPPSNAVCYELQCTNPAIKRCGSCLTARYCSQQCQRRHWNIHRVVCGDAGAMYEFETSIFVRHAQRAFLRTLLDHEYRKHKARILTLAVRLRYQARAINAELFVVVNFELTGGVCDVDVDVVPRTGNGLTFITDGFFEEVRRSAGRVWLHIVKLAGDTELGRDVVWLVVPLRCASAKLADGLEKVSRMPPSTHEEGVKRLMEISGDENH
ncbi:MYND-type domain-containing protein [Mycena kentingensis (nom. inval.)]|nr:MYND-type domain-containing protein [Mycena kentingensis (nom. inval.)]